MTHSVGNGLRAVPGAVTDAGSPSRNATEGVPYRPQRARHPLPQIREGVYREDDRFAIVPGFRPVVLCRPAAAGKPPLKDFVVEPNANSANMVRVSVDHANHFYKAGETMTVTVKSEKDCYLYLLYTGAGGSITCCSPTSTSRTTSSTGARRSRCRAATPSFRSPVARPSAGSCCKPSAPTSRCRTPRKSNWPRALPRRR